MSEIHGAVGSYVVHALDENELNEFEAHLASCETCLREVLEFAETAAHLGSLVETAPPPALRGSILDAIQQVRPLPPELPEEAPRSNVSSLVERAPRKPAEPIEWDEPTTGQPRTDELELRRQQRAKRLLAFATAAAVVVALVLGGFVVSANQQRQTQVAEAQLETQLLTAPDAKTYSTTMRDGTRVSFVASKSMNKALFVGNNLPAAGADKSYQLWTLDAKGKAVPDTVFVGGDRNKAWLSGNIRSASGLALTIEPEGGSQEPTLPIQAMTQL